MVSSVLPDDRAAAAPEIAVYLKEAVGNSTRIDYGTGSFVFVYIVVFVYLFREFKIMK